MTVTRWKPRHSSISHVSLWSPLLSCALATNPMADLISPALAPNATVLFLLGPDRFPDAAIADHLNSSSSLRSSTQKYRKLPEITGISRFPSHRSPTKSDSSLRSSAQKYRKLPEITGISSFPQPPYPAKVPETTGNYRKLPGYRVFSSRRSPASSGSNPPRPLPKTTGNYRKLPGYRVFPSHRSPAKSGSNPPRPCPKYRKLPEITGISSFSQPPLPRQFQLLPPILCPKVPETTGNYQDIAFFPAAAALRMAAVGPFTQVPSLLSNREQDPSQCRPKPLSVSKRGQARLQRPTRPADSSPLVLPQSSTSQP